MTFRLWQCFLKTQYTGSVVPLTMLFLKFRCAVFLKIGFVFNLIMRGGKQREVDNHKRDFHKSAAKHNLIKTNRKYVVNSFPRNVIQIFLHVVPCKKNITFFFKVGYLPVVGESTS